MLLTLDLRDDIAAAVHEVASKRSEPVEVTVQNVLLEGLAVFVQAGLLAALPPGD